MYDLHFSWSESLSRDQIDRMLRYAHSQGIHTVALTHTLQAPLPKAEDIKNPLPVYPTTPHTTKAPSSTPAAANSSHGGAASSKDLKAAASSLPPVTVLHRVNLAVAELPPNHYIAALSHHYHVVALRPISPEAFTQAVSSAPERGAPLISLVLSQRMPGFQLRGKPVRKAVRQNGIRFEVCTAHLAAETDERRRAVFVSNLLDLATSTGGRGLVLSSGAAEELYLGRPVDNVNMLAFLLRDAGVKRHVERLWESVGEVPRKLVAEELMRRRSARGVVEIVQLAPGPAEGDGKPNGPQAQQKQQQGPGQGAGKKKSRKRKGETESSAQPPVKKARSAQAGK